jgi:hypothetical protein
MADRVDAFAHAVQAPLRRPLCHCRTPKPERVELGQSDEVLLPLGQSRNGQPTRGLVTKVNPG